MSSSKDKWSRLWRGAGAVCGAILVLGLVWVLLFAPQRIVIGDPDTPEAATGLQIDKIGPDTALADTIITYTLLVTNNTAQWLNDVIITDTWNSQLYSGTYENGGSVAIGSVVSQLQGLSKYMQFNLTPLQPNSNGYLLITMAITGGLQPRFTAGAIGVGNSVVITTSTPGVTANTDGVTTMIVGPLLMITKTVTSTATVRPGYLLTYTLLVRNQNRNDAIDATHVVITERLPNNLIFQEAIPANIATFSPTANTIRWDWPGTLPVSTSVFVTFTARVTPTAPYANITNAKANCGVRADALPLGILCSTDVSKQVDDVFEKVGLTVSPPQQTGSISRTFPNRIMTYTVSVYNPFTETVTGMLLTDTLPNNNNVPTQTFYYSGLLSSSSPATPTVVNQTSRLVAWQLPTLQPSSVYTFSFRAFVPPQMFIDDNSVSKDYSNKLAGSYGNIVLPTNDGGHDNSMKTSVVRQIELMKTVTPTAQHLGDPVTYTLVVSNAGPTTVTDIQLTDVLPNFFSGNDWCAFVWAGYVSGQQPISASGNRVSWSGITLTGYSQITLATFRATVYGKVGLTCNNTVQGYSPDSYIVRRTNLAPVTVLDPIGSGGPATFKYDKTVSPSSVVLGDQIQYTVRFWSLTNTVAHLSTFQDTLPPGFFYSGNPIFLDNPELDVQPYPANEYRTVFPVDVVSTTEPCDKLPQPVYQLTGTLKFHVSSPPALADDYYNPSRIAPVMVYPQATMSKIFTPTGALPGGVITFTIVLTNNKSSPLNRIRVTDTLPNGFIYGGVLPGTPREFAWSPPNLYWFDLTIPSGGKLTLSFTTTAPSTLGGYQNEVTAGGDPADPPICIPRYKTPSFSVKRGVIEVSKQASPKSVNPLGQFQYNISLKNIGPYSVTVSRFTETLPGIAGYPWKYVSMQSGDPLPISTDPLVWTNLQIGPDKTQSLRVNVRASYQVGTYPNLAPPDNPLPLSGYMTGTVPPGWVLTQTSSYDKAPVNVVPGIGIDKDVYPTIVTATSGVTPTVIYTITVVNISANAITNVRITDTLPTGFAYDRWISGDLPQSTNPPVWITSTLPANTLKRFVFRARISSKQGSGIYYNRLSLTANGIYFPPMGNLAPVTVKGAPNLILGKTVSPNAVTAGRSVTYTLTLQNPDPSDPVTARVTDTLPSGFTFAEMINGPTPIATTPQVVWAVTVPATATQIISFRAVVDVNTPDETYYNQLDGSSTQLVFPGTGPVAPVIVVQPVYDLQVSKTDGAYTATIGNETVYTIRYTNTLNSLSLTAGGVVLTETFAPSDYLIADAPNWNLVSPGVYTYSVGDLPVGATGQVTFGLQINNSIPVQYLTITNTAAIDSAGVLELPEALEQSTANNVATDVDLIRGVDLAVTGVSYSPSSLVQGRSITVVVTVANLGLDIALGPDGTGVFGTDLYLKPANSPAPTGPGDRYLGACPTNTYFCPDTIRWNRIGYYQGSGLGPGDTATLTYTTKLESGGTQWIYIQADTFWGQNGDPDPTMFGSSENGRIYEPNEANNIYGPVAIFVIPKVYLPLIRK